MDTLELTIKEKAFVNYLDMLDITQIIEEMLICCRLYKEETYDDEYYFRMTVCRKELLDTIEKLEDSTDGG